MGTYELQNEARDEQKTPGQRHQHVMKTTEDQNLRPELLQSFQKQMRTGI